MSQNDESQFQFQKVWNDFPNTMDGLIQIYAKSWQMVIVSNPEPFKAMLEGWTKPWNLNISDNSNPFLKMLPENSSETKDSTVDFTNFWWNPWALFGEQFKAYADLFQKFTEAWMNSWKHS